MYKNIASQKLAVYAYDKISGLPKTGDAANITAQISKDGAATAATNDVNPTELDSTDAPGIYIFDMLQAETNTDLIVLSAVSATTGVVLEPIILHTSVSTDARLSALDSPNMPQDVSDILTDTGTTLPAAIAGIPTTSGQPSLD